MRDITHFETVDDINIKEMKEVIREAIANAYGIISIYEFKKGRNKEEGIRIIQHTDKTLSIHVHVVASMYVKATEALRSCRKGLSYRLYRAYPQKIRDVSVYLEDVVSTN